MAARRIHDCTFAVVDVETTGIDASAHRIIEVAVVTCDHRGVPLERYETLVRPEDDAAGARAEMLAGAPSFAEIAGAVVARLGAGVVAGHNVAFDLRFLDAELGRLGHRLPFLPYVCTRDLATLLGCDVPNRTLASLCAHCGITFERWHTAGDDATATAAVLGRLLARAESFGRTELASMTSTWLGSPDGWPELPPAGPPLVRDVACWPPQGDQPGSRRAHEPSFRRLGEGPPSPSGTTVVDGDGDDWSSPGSANERWWRGDLRGLEGIAQLSEVIVPTFRANQDPELIPALVALADLLRRHGGRDAEVRATFEEAYALAIARADSPGATLTFDRWWAHLAALRDTEGLTALLARSLGSAPLEVDVVDRALDQMALSARHEPLVALRLGRGARAALLAAGQPAGADRVLVGLIGLLDRGGRTAEATSLLEEAWRTGASSATVLELFSARLEREGDHERAMEVCARALAGPRPPAAVLTALRRRHRRCQERWARSATLFG